MQPGFGYLWSTKSTLEPGVVIAIPTLRRLRHEDFEFVVSLDGLARPCFKTETSHHRGCEDLGYFWSTVLQSTWLSPQVTGCHTTAPL